MTVKKHFGLMEYVAGVARARKGLNIPVATGEPITNWRTANNGKSILFLVPKSK